MSEVEFFHTLRSGRRVLVFAVGAVVFGLNGSREFPPEADQVEFLNFEVSDGVERLNEQLPRQDLEAIEEKAHEELIESARG